MGNVVQYLSLSYEDYKELEEQMREFGETVHTTTGGFYHKSIRLRVGKALIMEFHGPNVKAAELSGDQGTNNPRFMEMKTALQSLANGEITAREVAIKASDFVKSIEEEN